jgi:hypothetical protein
MKVHHAAHSSTFRSAISLVALTTLAAALDSAAQPATSPPAEKLVYVFSYFLDNGQDGLHLAISQDGRKFEAMGGGKSFLTPTLGGKLMRDPSVALGPDGQFHMVWTTGWWDKGIGLAHSKDLVTWSEQTWIPVMEDEPTTRNSWAPEIFYDAPTGDYLIFWASTIPGRFPETEPLGDRSTVFGGHLDHRMYVITTRDFKTFSKRRLFYDGGFNTIDAVLVRTDTDYALFVKDETRFPEPKKNIRIARGKVAAGPFGPATSPFTESWVEGPSVARVGDKFLLYYDEYTRHRYGALESKDLLTWTPAAGIEFPKGARHGTVFTAPARLLETLRNAR